jgi:hypothetical protein
MIHSYIHAWSIVYGILYNTSGWPRSPGSAPGGGTVAVQAVQGPRGWGLTGPVAASAM